jgi:RNA polymerase sigma factor (sigma-70 family)
MFDQSIITEIKNGRQEKLTQIYRAHRDEFISWAGRNFQCGEEIAKDIFQMSMVIFYENIISGKLASLHSSVKTYLFAIGKNKIMEHQLSNKRQQTIQEHFIREPLLEDYSEEKEETIRRVEGALVELGEPCKSLLELYYYRSYSIEQIAFTLNYKSNDSAKTQKYKCLTRLKKLMHQQTSSSLNG